MFLGKPYDELLARQQRRRRADIKAHMQDRAAPLGDIGVEVVSVNLRSTGGNAFELQLANTETEESDNSENIEVVSSITGTHRISVEGYHELSMKFSQLPRSYKVRHVAI